MKSKSIVAVAVAVLATLGASAFAQGSTASFVPEFGVDRAQVRNEVRTAMAVGTLVPPGERGLLVGVPGETSTLTRAEVAAEVRQAFRNGALIAAGQGPIGNHPTLASEVTRLAVKTDVRRASANGELVPAGEGVRAPLYATQAPRGGRAPVAYATEGQPVARLR